MSAVERGTPPPEPSGSRLTETTVSRVIAAGLVPSPPGTRSVAAAMIDRR